MIVTWAFATVALGAGLALGIVVTRNLHGNPRKRFWNVPVGGGLRRANLPVGGTVAGCVAALLSALGRPDAALIVGGAGVGMALGATGYGFFDPLPKTRG
jgi:hypothetical protein